MRICRTIYAVIFQRLLVGLKSAQKLIQDARGQPAVWALNAERHGLASRFSHQVIKQMDRHLSKRDYN